MKESLFPSKIASGFAFCNREEERKILVRNFHEIRHTVIISPRRYGKTSLALQAISEAKLPYSYINLFNAFKNESVSKRFIKGISDLITQATPAPQKALKKLSQILGKTKISLEFMGAKAALSFQPTGQEPLEIIEDLLENTEKVLESTKRTAVLFIDEFQDIVKTEMNDEFQAVLRDFAQRTKCVSLIISGSHRHMLNKIFDDRDKPFYKLCDRINLERIKSEAHEIFIQKHAKSRWKNLLSDDAIINLLNLTENHPYYVNKLCSKLWGLVKIPDVREIMAAWDELLQEEFDSLANDLFFLTKNQRILLQAIARKGYLLEHTSQSVSREVDVAPSSISDSIEFLEKNDFIENTEQGYRLVDPLMGYLLSREEFI